MYTSASPCVHLSRQADARTHRAAHVYTWAITAVLACSGCGQAPPEEQASATLVLAAYSAPREALEREILPAFKAAYRARTGKALRIEASYLASGAQTRAILGGFAADVVLLALAPDVGKLANAGVVAKTWADGADRGIVASTVVAFAVRTGNPKEIHGFADLAKPGVAVLMPNPRTSGGAMWNISALWGASLRGIAGAPPNDEGAARDYLRAVLKNVVVLDKGARESIITFEKGVGDVAVTYESEIVAGHLAGRRYDSVVPEGTLLIEIPAAVAGGNAAKHGVMAEAEELVAYLRSDDAQRAFAKYGFRAPNGERIRLDEPLRSSPATFFTVRDLGGWDTVVPKLFGPNGEFTKTWERVYAE